MFECTSTHQFLQGILLALLIVSALVLFLRSHRAKHKWVLWCVGIVWILGTIVYWYIYTQIKTSGLIETVDGWLPALIISAISSAQMFVGSTRFFDNGFQELFYSDEGFLPLILLSFLSLVAVMLSAYVVFNVFIRRVSSKWRLSGFPRDNEVHIFFGNNSRSQLLAEDIAQNLKDKKIKIIIVEYPDDEKNTVDESFIGNLYRMISSENINSSFIYLRSKNTLVEVADQKSRIERILDLRGLDKWLFRKMTSIYLLSYNEDENLKSLTVLYNYLAGKNLHVGPIYCHARREGLSLETEHEYRKVLNFSYVDSSNLSVRQILREDTPSMPVNFVCLPTASLSETETDLSITKYGCVSDESCFNSAIFGFGELGHEAFNFIYEFGAFPIRKNGTIDKCPWHAHVFDKRIDEIDFQRRYPGFGTHPSDSVSFHEGDFNEEQCWTDFRELVSRGLNYIVICSGNDDLNLELLLRIDQCYENMKIGEGHSLRIMVKYNKSQIESLFNNQIKNVKGCFQFFGIEKNIWKYNIISDERFIDKAIRFSTSYKMCADIRALDTIIAKNEALQQLKKIDEKDAYNKAGVEAWRERELSIANAQNSSDKNSLLRKRAQDMANAWHCYTKEHLIDSNYLDEHAKELAGLIPISYPEGTKKRELHAPTASPLQLEILENLAVCEKLRWNASHIVLGYKYGERTNDEKKVHDCLKVYSDLPEGKIQHYDWLVVKNTLSLYAEKHLAKQIKTANE